MKIKNKIGLKHMFHHAKDLMIDYEIDIIERTVIVNVDWIDSSRIEWFLRVGAVDSVNQELEKTGKQPLIKNMNGFDVELVVAEKARFDLALIERDFEPREPTLVLKLKE